MFVDAQSRIDLGSDVYEVLVEDTKTGNFDRYFIKAKDEEDAKNLILSSLNKSRKE